MQNTFGGYNAMGNLNNMGGGNNGPFDEDIDMDNMNNSYPSIPSIGGGDMNDPNELTLIDKSFNDKMAVLKPLEKNENMTALKGLAETKELIKIIDNSMSPSVPGVSVVPVVSAVPNLNKVSKDESSSNNKEPKAKGKLKSKKKGKFRKGKK